MFMLIAHLALLALNIGLYVVAPNAFSVVGIAASSFGIGLNIVSALYERT